MSKVFRPLAAIVLAAGKGKRMKSDLPKVLHDVAGKPMVQHVIDTLRKVEIEKIVVVIGHGADLVREKLADSDVEFVEQKEQLGTGHAVQMAKDSLKEFDGDVVVLAGDVPLLRTETITELVREHRRTEAVGTVLTAKLPDPTGYGRIVRDSNNMISKIVEHKDASEEEKLIAEINTGTFIFNKSSLFEALDKVDNKNKQGEYYLTDVMQIFQDQRLPTAGYCVSDYRETLGVNSREQLEEIESIYKSELT